LDAQSRIVATIGDREPRKRRKHTTPGGLLITWPLQNGFLQTASDAAAEQSGPTKVRIPQGAVAECVRCPVKVLGLKNADVDVEVDVVFI
jgi:hypothetical protein